MQNDEENAEIIADFDRPSIQNVREAREVTRSRLAIFFPSVYAVTLLVSMTLVIFGKFTIDDAGKIAAIFVTPVLTINATILGFYFGKDSKL